MKYQIKQLSLGGILDQSISIVRDHAGLLFGIVATTIIPMQVVLGFLQENMQNAVATHGDFQTPLIVMMIFALVIGMPLGVLVNASVIHAVASVYLSRSTTIGDCFRHGIRRFWPLVGTSFLMFLAMMGGIMLCLVPGILFGLWFCLAQHVTVLEATAGTAALQRSRTLMKGNMLTALALGVIVWFICVGIALVAGMIPQVHAKILVTAVIQGITTLVATAVVVVFYFSCRCKAENFDLQILAEAVGAEKSEPAVEGN